MRDRSKLGIAIAAMIRITLTTIRSSIKEKPFCLRMRDSPFWRRPLGVSTGRFAECFSNRNCICLTIAEVTCTFVLRIAPTQNADDPRGLCGEAQVSGVNLTDYVTLK